MIGWLIAAATLAASPATDGEAWNEGVDYYRRGEVTNALRVLRPLMLTKDYGARAAEVVAKLELERGNREEAASAAQIALRANPDDARAGRNFTRASDGLLEYREAKHIDEVLKGAQGKDAGGLMKVATEDARRLMTESGAYRTNAPAKAVAMAGVLSRRAERLADAWLPVREEIARAVTNEEQAATIVQQLEQARAKTAKAARELEDLNGEAYATLSEVEHDFTRFLKLTAMPPAALGEGMTAQSNAWQDVENFNGRSWQQDALDYTRAFRAKFPSWARAYEQQAQANTNMEQFAAEDQAKVSALATELEKVQIECCEKSLPPSQEKALKIMRQISELLPKDKNGGGQQGQQNQNQQQNQDKQQDQQQNQEQNQQNQQQDQQDQQGQQEQQEEQQQEEEKGGEESEEEAKDEEVEATLKKAQERNDEHEAEKKARMRKAPLPPNERDW